MAINRAEVEALIKELRDDIELRIASDSDPDRETLTKADVEKIFKDCGFRESRNEDRHDRHGDEHGGEDGREK